MDRVQTLFSKKWILNGRLIQTDGKDNERETLALLDRLDLPNHNTDYYTRDRIGQLLAESPAMYETLKAMLELMSNENGEIENHDAEVKERRAYRLPAHHRAEVCAICAAREIIQRIENP